MRIIAGKFKGHPLESPRGRNTRPTTDHVRESVFNLLATRTRIDGSVVLDAFCGTGAFGLESISRGAARAVFVDTSREALKIAARNAASLGVENQCRFLLRDAVRYFRKPPEMKFDVVFADPPYSFLGLTELPQIATNVLSDDGLLVLEHDKHHRFDEVSSEMESRSYGRTIVTIFRASSSSLPNQAETQ